MAAEPHSPFAARHPDLQFEVCWADGRSERLRSFDAAIKLACHVVVHQALPATIHVLTWSRQAALEWGGEKAAEAFDLGPGDIVHQRITVSLSDQPSAAHEGP